MASHAAVLAPFRCHMLRCQADLNALRQESVLYIQRPLPCPTRHAAAPAFGLSIVTLALPGSWLASFSPPFVPQPSPFACAPTLPPHRRGAVAVPSHWQACCAPVFSFPAFCFSLSTSVWYPAFLPPSRPPCALLQPPFSSSLSRTILHLTAPYRFETSGLPDPFASSCLPSASFMRRASRLPHPGRLGAMPYPAPPSALLAPWPVKARAWAP